MKRSYFRNKPRKPLSKKRKKRSEKEILKEKAWQTFSRWIRNRDPYCVTHLILGKKVKSENAGHFWHAVLDFDEENINGQCVNCNKWNSGRLAEYSTYLINKLGYKAFKALEARHFRAMAGEYRTDKQYQDIIDKYAL